MKENSNFFWRHKFAFAFFGALGFVSFRISKIAFQLAKCKISTRQIDRCRYYYQESINPFGLILDKQNELKKQIQNGPVYPLIKSHVKHEDEFNWLSFGYDPIVVHNHRACIGFSVNKVLMKNKS